MKRRKIFIIMCLLMVPVIFICSCAKKGGEQALVDDKNGGNQGEGIEKEKGEEKTGEDEPSDGVLPLVGESVTLSFMCRENQAAAAPTYGSGELPVWNEIERLTNVKIDWQTVIASDYDVAVQTKLAAGVDLPDMICVPDPVPYLRQDIFLPLEDLIDEYAPDIKKMLEEHPDVKASMTAFDDKIYCITQVPKEINNVHTRMMFIRKDWLDRLDLPIPETIDDWYNVLKAFKENDANGNGDKADEFPMISPGSSELGTRAFAAAFDIVYAYTDGYSVGDDGKVRLDWIRPEAKEYMTFMKKLIDEKLFSLADNDEKDMRTSNDTAGSVDAWPDYIAGRNTLLTKNVAEGHFVGTPPPSSEFSKGFYITPHPSYGYETGIFITKQSKHPDIAMKWINFLFSEEGYLLTNYGIEEEHYNMVDGKPILTEYFTKNPDGLSSGEAQRFIGARPSFANFMSQDFEVQCKKADENIGPTVDILLDSGKAPTFPKVMADKDEVEVLKTIGVDLTTYVDENVARFILGERSLDEFDKFVEEVKSMELDKVLDVKQKQYDRYAGIVK